MAVLETREASSSDFDFAWEVYAEAVKPLITGYIDRGWDEAYEKNNFASIWKTEDTHIAQYDGEDVGWFSYTIEGEGDTVRVDHGYLKASHQRRGIASIIANFIIEEARRRGLRFLVAEVLNNNTMIPFFERNGFQMNKTGDITSEFLRPL